MAYEHVRLAVSPARVATLTIARPERLNALSGQTVDELRGAVGEAASSGARCLLLAGEGRGFSSGADLATGGGLPEDAGAALEKHFNPLIEALFALPIPVVAAGAGAGARGRRPPWPGPRHRRPPPPGFLPPAVRHIRP